MKNIKIGKAILGINKKCFIVAEISANHNSSIKNAIKLVKVAALLHLASILREYNHEPILLDFNNTETDEHCDNDASDSF